MASYTAWLTVLWFHTQITFGPGGLLTFNLTICSNTSCIFALNSPHTSDLSATKDASAMGTSSASSALKNQWREAIGLSCYGLINPQCCFYMSVIKLSCHFCRWLSAFDVLNEFSTISFHPLLSDLQILLRVHFMALSRSLVKILNITVHNNEP